MTNHFWFITSIYIGTSLNDDPAKRQNRMAMTFCDGYSDSQNSHSNGQFSLNDDLVRASQTVYSQDNNLHRVPKMAALCFPDPCFTRQPF